MEQLTEKILTADFASKKNLLHNIRAKNYFFIAFIGLPLIYSCYCIYNTNGRFNSIENNGLNNKDIINHMMSKDSLCYRLRYRPEIYALESNYYQKELLKELKDNVDLKKLNYKPYVWE